MTRDAGKPRRGFTIVEVTVALMLLSMGLMAIVGLSTTSLRTASRASEEGRYYADAQEVIDSLMSLGFGVPVTGSTTIRGRPISWTVGSSATAPQLVTIAIQRTGYINKAKIVKDTIILYLSKRNPGP
jgi:prepilin-type N-terminal cleavage/methylation domain-containing protein